MNTVSSDVPLRKVLGECVCFSAQWYHFEKSKSASENLLWLSVRMSVNPTIAVGIFYDRIL